MSDDAESRLRERRVMLLIWASVVLVIMLLGSGLAGGFRVSAPNSLAEWLSWLIPLSPIMPLVLWLRARKQVRDRNHTKS